MKTVIYYVTPEMKEMAAKIREIIRLRKIMRLVAKARGMG